MLVGLALCDSIVLLGFRLPSVSFLMEVRMRRGKQWLCGVTVVRAIEVED